MMMVIRALVPEELRKNQSRPECCNSTEILHCVVPVGGAVALHDVVAVVGVVAAVALGDGGKGGVQIHHL